MNNEFEIITIIYNPMGTSGKAKIRAERLYRQLKRRRISHIELLPSEYAGHAEVIAYEKAVKYIRPLIISVSGDGGYNEVINGTLKAKLEKRNRKPVCAILAAGNANDYRKATAKRPLIRAITHNAPELVDILQIQFGRTNRFAHSYIGVGTTAETAAELNQSQLTRWKEIKIVTRNLLNFRHFSIIEPSGRVREIDSLVFANIHRMSKVIRINTHTDLHDGLFSAILIPHRSRLKFFYLLIKLVVFGGKNPPQLSSYTFQLKNPQLGQLDGEVIALTAKTDITVSINASILETIS